MSNLLTEYDRLKERLVDAKERTASAKARYERALDDEREVERALEKTREAIEQALSSHSAGEPATEPPDPADAEPEISEPGPTPPTPPPPEGIRPSLWEVILVIPRDGDVGMDEFRQRFALSDGAINTRITKAKQAGLVESAGWGRYKLTPEGKKLQSQRLKVVSGN